MAEFTVHGDVRPALPSAQAPTLVPYRSHDRFAGKPHATYLAEHIPGARLVELPGQDNLCLVSAPEAALGEIELFLTGSRRAPDTDRVLATVRFTDIVGSTRRAADGADRRWRELLDAHDGAVRRQLERFRGRQVTTVDDGFVATFDAPGKAVECAVAIRDAVRVLGLEVRAGLHTGEIEVRRDDIGRIGVHVAARVVGHAAGGQVLTSAAVHCSSRDQPDSSRTGESTNSKAFLRSGGCTQSSPDKPAVEAPMPVGQQLQAPGRQLTRDPPSN
jgi:class 3 adenylate cyclase